MVSSKIHFYHANIQLNNHKTLSKYSKDEKFKSGIYNGATWYYLKHFKPYHGKVITEN